MKTNFKTPPDEGSFENQEQVKKYFELNSELHGKVKLFNGFIYEGIYFKGNLDFAIQVYIDRNPSDKFFIWMQNNWAQFELKNIK